VNIKGFPEIGRIDAAKGVRTEPRRGEKRDSAPEAQTGEQVTLTPTAQRFREAARSASTGASVDEARVESLRADLAAGRYTIDPKRIAAKLLDVELAWNRSPGKA
jgi:negative regulator of flagellin synthesis FlgM